MYATSEKLQKKRILIVRDKDKSALENKIQQYNKNDLLLHLRYSVSIFFKFYEVVYRVLKTQKLV